jgi:hypothetical protein
MPGTVQDIITGIQNELEDNLGSASIDWADPDYIITKLANLGTDIGMRLQVLDLNYQTQEVIIPNVPANTQSLLPYQQAGQPLAEMIVPKSVEYRLVGQNQQEWIFVDDVQKLIDTDTGTGLAGSAIDSDDPTVESYEWRQGVLSISPCETAVDLRIRFSGTVISLNATGQQTVVGLQNIYIYKGCAVICASRNGGPNTLSQWFDSRFEKSCADFEMLSVKSQQNMKFRLGGRRSSCNSGWGTDGFRPPFVNN